MRFSYETEEEVDIQLDLDGQQVLILYNDDVNTFDHVIDSLVEECNHTTIQAEQVAWIVHTKGKCDVKHGPFDKLYPICKRLQDRGLSAVIQS
jgi:ATP-dependent Clp protease adaptor protein ClpS